MSIYALSMDCPHATDPDVRWRVMVFDDVAGTGCGDPEPNHDLWVPHMETWTLDTLRMVLHELAAYLPAHDDATVTICAKTNRQSGRARKDGTPRQAIFNKEVEITVSARGWSAVVWAWRNEKADTDGKYLGRGPGQWSEPMQAVLLDLAAKSPFPLATVRVVNCGDPYALNLRPARRDVLRGIEPAESPKATDSHKKRLKRLIDDILGGEK